MNMRYETDTDPLSPPIAAAPAAVVMTDRAIAAVRAYLQSRGLESFQIFHSPSLDIDEIDRYLDGIGEASAQWESLSCALQGVEALDTFSCGEPDGALHRSGFLHLSTHELVLFRWSWIDTESPLAQSLCLCAAPSPAHFTRLRQQLRTISRQRAAAVWQIVSGDAYLDAPRVPRTIIDADQDLFLTDSLRKRIEVDVIQFFQPTVQQMYQSLNVPYRRGVLLHGPPGNGKTTIIRLIGSRLPDVPAMILRPAGNFDADDFRTVIQRWTRQSPSILVIEDLNWLLKTIDLSLFLNLLDGIEAPNVGGLMVLATTNHPDLLDPALNNRPGRFDVVIEVSCPDESLRRRFFLAKLDPQTPEELIERLVRMTDGLSFAHHQELLRLSGLLAINAARCSRSEEDLIAAAKIIQESHEDAERGFGSRCGMKFGFQHLHPPRKGE